MSKPESIDLLISSPSSGDLGEKIANLAFSIESTLTEDSKPWKVYATNDAQKLRSTSQNGLLQCYYHTIQKSNWGEGKSRDDIEVYCKRRFAIPILEKQAVEINEKKGLPTRAALDAQRPVNIIECLKELRVNESIRFDYILRTAMSSIMTSENFCLYLKEIEIHFIDKLNYRLESINTTLRNNALNIK